LKEFSFSGRFSVIVATWSATSNRTVMGSPSPEIARQARA
jgi:hypothetical protein